MNQPNTLSPIVVGIDGSAVARDAALWAAGLADHADAELLLVSAVADPSDYYYRSQGMPMYPNLADELRKHAEVALEHARAAVHDRHPKVYIDTMPATGPAEIALVQLSGRARLTVVGAHTDPASHTTVIGPTALRVANHAEGLVAVWRGDPDRPPRPGAPVVLGVDGSAANANTAKAAFELAAALHAPVTAVHACQYGTPEQACAELSEWLAPTCAEYPDVRVHQIVRESAPAQMLLQCSEHAQALVVGSRVHSGALATLLGSTTEHLLHHARVPLLLHRGHSG